MEEIKKESRTRKFINSKGESLKQKITCELCKGTYTYFNKSHHYSTKRHKMFIVTNDINEIIDNL